MSEQPPVDHRVLEVTSGEIISIPALANKSPFQCLADMAEPYMATARRYKIPQLTFSVGQYEVTVRNK